MKALAICGSPRKKGNTEILLNRCLEVINQTGIETELIRLAEENVKPCKACGVCKKTADKTCIVKNDDFHKVLEKMLDADIIIVGSPVYFGSATPEIMSLLHRSGYVSRGNGNLFTKKVGGPITVARRAGQNFTLAQLSYWFSINDMIMPGSSYWNIAQGGAIGEVENDEEGIKTIEKFGENLAWLAKKLNK